MLQFEELRLKLIAYEPEIKELAGAIGLTQMQRELAELEQRSAADGFWDDMEKAQKVTQRAANLRQRIEAYDRLVADYEDGLTLIEMADEVEDLDMLPECEEAVNAVAKKDNV